MRSSNPKNNQSSLLNLWSPSFKGHNQTSVEDGNERSQDENDDEDDTLIMPQPQFIYDEFPSNTTVGTDNPLITEQSGLLGNQVGPQAGTENRNSLGRASFNLRRHSIDNPFSPNCSGKIRPTSPPAASDGSHTADIEKKPETLASMFYRSSIGRVSSFYRNQKNGIYSSQGNNEMWKSQMKVNYAPSEGEGILKQKTSYLVADKYIKSSPEYKECMKVHRPIATIMFWIYLILAPLVLRYAMASYYVRETISVQTSVPGNATIGLDIAWNHCENCLGDNGKGVTLKNFNVSILNIVNAYPNYYSEGFPSIAVFASHDFVNWYNFYAPPSVNMATIQNFDNSTFFINQTLGEACLGDVQISYLVVCLNNGYIADGSTRGGYVAPPPFNDRCSQVYGKCGVPCADLKGGKYPRYCPGGVISDQYLYNSNSTTFTYTEVNRDIAWFNGITIIDWIVLAAIILDAFGNILRYLPVLSGGPTELQKENRDVVVTGRAVMTNVSPFAGEKEGIFLRNLIGRTATALHTAGSRHNIRTLYIDAIVNENCTNMARYQQWKAWMDFLSVLCSFKCENMHWKESWRKANPNAPKRIVTVGQGESKIYLCDPTSIDFEGYKDYNFDLSGESDYSRHLSAECIVSKDMSKAKKINLIDILPALCFLDGWLEQIKASESKFPNYNNNETYMLALQSVFNAAPCQKYFQKEHFLKVHEALEILFDSFGKNAAPRAPKSKMYKDFRKEHLWRVSRGEDMPTVDIAWVYFSRAKLDADLPTQLVNCTEICKASIVYVKPVRSKLSMNPLVLWLQSRAKTYQVINIHHRRSNPDDPMVTLTPWPAKRPTVEKVASDAATAVDSNKSMWSLKLSTVPNETSTNITVQLSQLELICKNRGKAGALNTFLEYSRHRASLWAYVTGHDEVADPIQHLYGIVDARHMLAEPEVFWNEALPYFSRNRQTGAHTKNMGDNSTSVILIQYPQYFSNVGQDDYLDNKNSAYYVIWQTLRDCSKTITSSGTNAIWDASDPNFKMATCCRIEDTATTQEYLDKYFTVHLPFFVAHGIAKDTEDYIEAVYRWSTGAVELFWSTISDYKKLYHFFIVAQLFIFFCVAGLAPSVYAYYGWLFMAFSLGLWGYLEKRFNRRPYRFLNISATIVTNTFYWVSNWLSLVWLVLVPISISFLQVAPLADTAEQALTWSFTALVLRLPPAIICDQIIAMARFLSPEVRNGKKYNFNLFLWRSSQLYACSFAYSMLSFVCGTISSYNAFRFYQDNTFWASFKNVDGYWTVAIYHALQSPEFLTRILALSLIMVQFACVVGSIVLQFSNSYLTLVTVIVCGFNLALVIEIAMLLFPKMSNHSVLRPEYAFAAFAVVLIAAAVRAGLVPTNAMWFAISNT